MPVLVELLKIAALAALVAMLLTLAVSLYWAATLGLLVLWLLLVKAS